LSNSTLDHIKRYAPLGVAGAFFLLVLFFQEAISIHLSDPNSRVNLDGVFAAVFDWSSIQTGFLFAVYGFVVGKGDGFIAAVRKTEAMREFTRTIKRAILTGFVLTITSMALLFYPLKPLGWEFWIISVWLALFVWAFLLFCSVAYTFGVIVKVPDQQAPKGAK